MLNRFCLVLMAVFASAPLWAQDAPVKMTPEFCFTFPLTNNGDNVTVKYPVLINPGTVIKPGMVLRTIYMLSLDNSGNNDIILAHKGTLEDAFARDANPGDSQKLPSDLEHELDEYRKTVWQVSNNFVLAMAQYSTDQMHLLYTVPGKDDDINDERFSFFDGMFVGLPDGKVTVLAVEVDSKADRAGIKAGDEIVAVGGISTQNDLATFAAGYAATKKLANVNETSSYAVTINSGGKTRVVNVPMPPKIKSSLMDGF